MSIGQRIKNRREELGMSQEELARKAGYKSRSSINKIEVDGRGLPQNKMVAIAKALDTTPACLMGWNEPELETFNTATAQDKMLERLYMYWKNLTDTGKKKVLDNAEDISKIYSKDNIV